MVFTTTPYMVTFQLPNPLLVNNLLKRNTRVDRFVGTASADVDLLKMIGIDSKTTSSTIKSISLTANPLQGLHLDSCMGTEQPCLSGQSNERLTKATRSYADALIERADL